MRKTFSIFLAIAAIGTVNAQAPQSFSYQGVARDNSGGLLTNTGITVQMIIHDGSPAGTIVYSEQHAPTTNDFGGFSLGVGSGSVLSGTFASINWASGTKYLEQLIDFGSGLQSMGTTQLLSVPFALEAAHAPETDPEVGIMINNFAPKWDGAALTTSNIFSNGNFVGINATSAVASANFVVGNVNSSYGGMYINSTGNAGIRKPFYGYSIGSEAQCWTYFEESSGSWIVHNFGEDLALDSFGNLGVGTLTPDAKLEVTGNMILGEGGTVINSVTKATVNRDLPSIAADAASVQTFAVPNASLGGTAFISPEFNFATGLIISYVRVSSEGNVTAKFYNASDDPIDPAVMDFYISVID